MVVILLKITKNYAKVVEMFCYVKRNNYLCTRKH